MRLRQQLLSRNQGLWEPLAAVAGDAAARERVRFGISAVALGRGLQGPADDPMVVGERVEAMAAWDLRLLAELAADWKPIDSLSSDVMDSDTDFWAVAWARSLRHLVRAGVVRAESVRTKNYTIVHEAGILWGSVEQKTVSWGALVERLGRGDLFYDEIRRLARVPLAESSLTAADVRACLDAGKDAREPLLLLRILRSRASLLDSGARSELETLIRNGQRTPGESALLVEIARRLRLPDLAECTRPLEDVVAASDSPRDVAPLAYVLLTTDWELP